eukprot:2008302-Prymnesium_polylepis.1
METAGFEFLLKSIFVWTVWRHFSWADDAVADRSARIADKRFIVRAGSRVGWRDAQTAFVRGRRRRRKPKRGLSDARTACQTDGVNELFPKPQFLTCFVVSSRIRKFGKSLILPVRRMDGAPSGQPEQFTLTSVRKSFWSASGIEPRTFLHYSTSRPHRPSEGHCSDPPLAYEFCFSALPLRVLGACYAGDRYRRQRAPARIACLSAPRAEYMLSGNPSHRSVCPRTFFCHTKVNRPARDS